MDNDKEFDPPMENDHAREANSAESPKGQTRGEIDDHAGRRICA
jgi:hypothetical protein